ncbi:suppressor of glycerol defect [Podospora pseudoanserina]|uniref:Suppressor of glycerol defect n=1 Tax=Podospora pseudoanserina TaxID=2609844 RepID=A0ABR0I5T3_9PEZI|nr:suppressor of glycerol defect [Podospora pseudoanserina]
MAPRGQGTIKRPALPPHLLKELGASDNHKRRDNRTTVTSRKEQRKAERQGKRTGRSDAIRNRQAPAPQRNQPSSSKSQPPKKSPAAPAKAEPKSALKNNKRPEPDSDEEDEDDFGGFDDEDDELSDGILNEDSDEDMGDDGEHHDDEDSQEDDEDEDEEEDEEDEDTPPPTNKKLSKTLKDKFAEDDAEIAALEKKLGMKGKKKLPQSFIDDGLGELLGELDGNLEDGGSDKRKRKAEADEWLAQKRRKAEAAAAASTQKKRAQPDFDESEDGDSDEDMDDMDEDMDGFGCEGDGLDGEEDEEGSDEGEEDGFDDFGSEDEDMEEPPAKKVRENPYVAPTTGQTAKYVPPSLRKATGSESELEARVRRQTQGLVNRITEANLLTILGEIEKLYRDNARQHVTSALVDLLLIQVCDPTSLPDTLLILSAGFASAAYKVFGTDFGAQLIQEVVERYDKYYEEAQEAALGGPDVPKQTSNLITFVSQLYNFQLIGPGLIFDYIRTLLDNLSELNAELLLRIVRMCGTTLRTDDPMALKDIVTLIPGAVAKHGEKNLTVRTKFMIETITDLKNNKLKAGAGASAIVSEHTAKMKKTLGQLKARKLKAMEPLRIGLQDIRDADKTGKWWLVGASWAGKSKDKKDAKEKPATEEREDDDSDDESIVLDDFEEGPDLLELAREQGMNTEVRRSIFVTILSALDVQDAYIRILKLRLNKERQREIATVITKCVGAEKHYNPYYTLIARKVCENMREVKWSFQTCLWKMFGRMGETGFVEEDEELEEEELEEEFSTQRLINTAKMVGSLIASGHMSLIAIRRLNLAYLQKRTRNWMEIMLNTLLLECQTGEKPGEEVITKVFAAVNTAPEFAIQLQHFLKKVTRKTDLTASKKETKLVRGGCKMAEAALQAVVAAEELL